MNQLATSLAGHDKGCVYAVMREDSRTVYLADGRGKTLDRPKKKNLRHIRKIADLPREVEEALHLVKQDSDLVHVLRLYQAMQCENKESDRRQ